MKSCLDIKCARTTLVTAKGGRGDTPPHASKARIPKSRLVSSRTVSRDREADRQGEPRGGEAARERGGQRSDAHLVTYAFL